MSVSKKGGAPAKKKQPPLIYVVDDEPMIGEVVEAILQLEGYRTRVFTSPDQAMLCVQKKEDDPALLLTDFVMPGLNGMELIEHCKKVKPNLKTILFSGNFGQDIMNYYPVKPDRFLSKPFQPKILTDLVKAVLE
jgi:two-component system cell cycle sensor histidine kinase/response regulator CckA